MASVRLDEGLIKGDSVASILDSAMDANGGLLRLTPTWVPRSFLHPGRRIKLHPSDYYRFGADRGGIDERWFGSTTEAANEGRVWHEGLSFCLFEGKKFLLKDAVAERGADLVGKAIFDKYNRWPVYSKFFDNEFPLPFHIHHRDEHAALVGKPGKPEAYYFPPQMNNHGGQFPYTFFGLHPEVTKEQLRDKLASFLRGGDNRITDLSKAYRVTPGTGWDVPAGILHAPASMCTYEPQAACDVFAMTESWSNNREVGDELLWKDVPDDRVGDLDFIVELVDWERNVDPEFWSNRFTPPVQTLASTRSGSGEYIERWITYRATAFSAKELTVAPGGAVTVSEQDAYGLIAVGGHGTINGQQIAAISSIRYGQFSSDEFFITAAAARDGVRVVNTSATDDLVILKHFGPGNVQLAAERADLGI